MEPRKPHAVVAQDLEKLPPELIEYVLADLDLVSIIRIAQVGGERAVWSIENSPAWSLFFRHHRIELQALLSLTDKMFAFCFKHPSRYSYTAERAQRSPAEHQPYMNYMDLGFLKMHIKTGYSESFLSGSSLCGRWRTELGNQLSMTVMRFVKSHHEFDECTRVLTNRQDAADFVRIGEGLAAMADWPLERKLVDLSTEDMARFVELVQAVRQKRQFDGANELERLATLYEQHPRLVKQPFAPQTRRSNENHVPKNLRKEAKRLRTKFVEYHGRKPCWYRFRHPFPNLVPYDWCLRLFVAVLDQHSIFNDQNVLSVYPQEILELLPTAVEGLSYFHVRFEEDEVDPQNPENFRSINTPWSVSEMPPNWNDLGKEPKFLTMKIGVSVFPHAKIELDWLEKFIECVTWMEKRFPDVVSKVRGEDWDAHSHGNVEGGP